MKAAGDPAEPAGPANGNAVSAPSGVRRLYEEASE
jgi:hypothetical protein